jgi:hypothetical protein
VVQNRLKEGDDTLTYLRLALIMMGKFFVSNDSPRYLEHCFVTLGSPLSGMLFRLNAAKQIQCATPILGAYHYNDNNAAEPQLLAFHFQAMITTCEALFNAAHDLLMTTEDDTF